MLSSGGKLGYGWQQIVSETGGRRVISWNMMRTREAAGKTVETIETSDRRDDASGQLRSVTFVSRIGGVESRTNLALVDGLATLTRSSRNVETVSHFKVPQAVRFDGGAGLLRTLAPASRDEIAFDNLNLKTGVIEHITLEVNHAAPTLADGAFEVIRTHWRGGDIQRLYTLEIGRDGSLRRTVQPRFGTDIIVATSDEATATAAFEPLSLVRSSMFKSPVRILLPALTGHIRFTFTFRKGLRFEPPATGEQSVRHSNDTVTIDVCMSCGAAPALTAPARADALAPTAWLQSGHPLIRTMVKGVAGSKMDDTRKMEILAIRARKRLRRIDFTGHFSAVDALLRGAGDCTEDAVVLAALGRAAGIPTKVASGIVYSRERYHGVSNVFLTHNWTLAWIDGKWRSFDMSIGAFDATHIATNISDGDSESLASASLLASLFDWKSVVQVKARPAGS